MNSKCSYMQDVKCVKDIMDETYKEMICDGEFIIDNKIEKLLKIKNNININDLNYNI